MKYAFFYWYLAALIPLILGAVLLFRYWRKESWIRLAAGNLVILLLILYAAFVAGEGWFYFFHDTTDGSNVLLSSRRWMERHVKPNEMGLRDERHDPSEPRRPGELRICVLGDSVAWGQGISNVGDRFSDTLERKLRAAGIPAAVFNVALPGWNTVQETGALMALDGAGITFDIVIMQYCLNDNFYVEHQPPAYVEANKRLKNTPRLVAAAVRRSLFLSFLYHSLTTFRDPVLTSYERLVRESFLGKEKLATHLEQMDTLREACRAQGAKLAVVIFPFLFGPWEDYIFGDMHRVLDGYWRESGVPCIDLLDDYRRFPLEELTVGRYDRHPNARANAIAAERMFREWFAPPGRLLTRAAPEAPAP